MVNFAAVSSQAFAAFVLQRAPYEHLKFNIYDANKPLTLALLAGFLIATIVGIVGLFMPRRRRSVGIALAAVTLLYLLVTGAVALFTDYSPSPLPGCVVIMAILSGLLLLLGRKSA